MQNFKSNEAAESENDTRGTEKNQSQQRRQDDVVPAKDTPQSTDDADNLSAPSDATADSVDADAAADNTTDTEQKPSFETMLAEKQHELDELRDKMMRQIAQERNEKEAFIARSNKAAEQTKRFAVTDLAMSLLPTVDDLQRSLKILNEHHPESAIGIAIVIKNIEQAFEKVDIKTIAIKIGDAFNPDYHSAISVKVDAKLKANTVIEIARTGYTLADRVLRPAEVIVAKAPSVEATESTEEATQESTK